MTFDPTAYLPEKLYHAITDVRVNNPELIFAEAARRRKRSRLTNDGKLVILATDHPGRRVTGVPANPLGMGDRHSYLARSLRVLLTPGCDGIMGTTDFMEDLLILNGLLRDSGGPELLDDKVLVGCMNRGGHAGVAGEIDDRFTSFTASQLAAMRFEGGKLMYRLDPGDPLSIAGRKFDKGIGAPYGDIVVVLDGAYAAFEAKVGVQSGDEGTAFFVVTVDGPTRPVRQAAEMHAQRLRRGDTVPEPGQRHQPGVLLHPGES